ncbi:hypothetical protein GGR26_003194 [Lewinella marina]|nr:S8 family serine peptidase [Neolewinella marina]NJB87414.1 hypothetical protein [Neolewinella marina]
MTPDSSRIPLIPYGEPAACAPHLITFGDLGQDSPDYGGQDPQLPDDGSGEGAYRLARLSPAGGKPVFLHVYNGTGGLLQLSVYGITDRGEAHTLIKAIRVTAVAHRLPLPIHDRKFPAYIIRFSTTVRREEKFQVENFVALSAYAGKEPGWEEADPDKDLRALPPFDCDGKAFHRLVLSSCERDDALKEWAIRTGLPLTDAYFGEAGSVIALGVPPGMDLNTTGGSAQQVRAKVNAGEGTVERDYIINFFRPEEPTDGSGETPRAGNDAAVGESIREPEEHFREALPPREPRCSFDEKLPPFTVAIIDSGVDPSAANRDRWETNRYRQGPTTAFIQTGKLGYDFLNRDADPEDETPHGTYVAAALQAQYRADHPLQLLHLKTFGSGGRSTYFGALVAIYEAIAAGARVINMSWGIAQAERPAALECAVRAAAHHGVFMVTSAGNDGNDLFDQPQWPAAFARDYPDHLLAVASYWYRDATREPHPDRLELVEWSNFGDEEVPLAAFLTTGVPEHGTGNLIYPVGTSISAPIVAGLLADWLARHPGGTLEGFRRAYFERSVGIADRVADGAYLPLKHTRVPV